MDVLVAPGALNKLDSVLSGLQLSDSSWYMRCMCQVLTSYFLVQCHQLISPWQIISGAAVLTSPFIQLVKSDFFPASLLPFFPSI